MLNNMKKKEEPKIKFSIKAKPKTVVKFKVRAAKEDLKHGEMLEKLLNNK